MISLGFFICQVLKMAGKEIPWKSSIDILGDYDLLNIFSYLTIRDLIVIERVSKKWRYLSERSWSGKKNICLFRDIGLRFPMSHLEDILKRSGNYVTCLDLQGLWCLNAKIIRSKIKKHDDLNNRLWGLNDVGKILLAVSEAHVSHQDIDDILLRSKLILINKHCKNLRQLKLKFCSELNDVCKLALLNDSVVEKLTHLSINFMMLSFRDQSKMWSPFLQRAVNLEKFELVLAGLIHTHVLLNITEKCKVLNLRHCVPPSKEASSLREIFNMGARDFSFGCLCKVFERLVNLEKLTMDSTGFLIKCLSKISNQLISFQLKGFGELDISIKHMEFEKLRTLKLIEVSGVDDEIVSLFVSKCPLLEKINLSRCKNVTDEGFQKLAGLSNLKVLNVNNTNIGNVYLGSTMSLRKVHCSGCKRLTSSGLIKLIELSPELSYLDIYYFEEKLTRNFFTAALKLVENRPNHISLNIEFQLKGKDTKELGLIDQIDRSLKYNYVRIVENYEATSKMDVELWNPKYKLYYVSSNETTTVQPGKGEESLEN